jgi:hypothetical protein
MHKRKYSCRKLQFMKDLLAAVTQRLHKHDKQLEAEQERDVKHGCFSLALALIATDTQTTESVWRP